MTQTKEAAVGSRRIALAVTGAFGLVVLFAVAAWACTPQAQISLNVGKGKPGTSVEVSGTGWVEDGKVRVYWAPNDGQPQFLFETTGYYFEDEATTIPDDAAAGAHYIKAYGYEEGDEPEESEPAGTATASFSVPHGAVSGEIGDAEAGEGVHGAEVSVIDDGDVLGTARTEADGTFEIAKLDKGAYTVTARRPGYEAASTQVEVRLGETSDVSLTLARKSQDDTSDSGSGSGDQQPDGSQSSEPEGSQTPRGSEGAEQPQGSQGAEPQETETKQPEDTSAQGTTLQGSGSGAPTPQESASPNRGHQATQPEQPAEDDPAHQAIEADETERQSIGAGEPERQTVGGADSAGSGGGDGDGEPGQGGPGGGDTAANQPQSVGEPQPSSGQAQPSTGEPADEEPAPAATAPELNVGEAPAEQAAPEPEAAESEAENTGHPAVGPDADASTPAPSARSGAADLWSGLAASDVATLGSDQPATDQSGETNQALVLAVGLLGAGLLTLASGGAVAARRRRAPAEATSSERSG